MFCFGFAVLPLEKKGFAMAKLRKIFQLFLILTSNFQKKVRAISSAKKRAIVRQAEDISTYSAVVGFGVHMYSQVHW